MNKLHEKDDDTTTTREQFLNTWKLDSSIWSSPNSTPSNGDYRSLFEPCMVGNDVLSLPVSLLCSPSCLEEIFSMQTWNELLDESDRDNLAKFLPADVDDEQQNDVVQALFDISSSNFSFVHPLKKFIRDLKSGSLHPEVVKCKQETNQLKEKCSLLILQNHQCDVLKSIIKYSKQAGIPVDNQFYEFCKTANPHEEELSKWLKINQKITERAARKRKKREIARKLYKSKKLYLVLLDQDSIESESEGSATDMDSEIADSAEDEDYEELTRKAKRHKQYKMQKKRKEAAAAAVKIGKEQGGKSEPSKPVSSFPVFTLFSTIKDTFFDNQLSAAVDTLCGAVSISAPLVMTIPPQYSLHSFVELALRFLSHPPRLPQQAAGAPDIHLPPFVEYVENTQQWKWKAPPNATMVERLESLEQLFYFTTTRKKINSDDSGKISIPFNLIKQQKCRVTIPETSSYCVALFHAQEKERFENCNKPYIFDVQGVKSIVAPLKKSANSTLRAREHALLVENRPGHINLLSLIRNAAARLPGGVGTRADVAQLMKDSQYVKPGSSDHKLNQVVSGALDRLQSASDPPVNYDPDQKLWIYLHRLRTEADFGHEDEVDDEFFENAEEG